jgi:hypothetical protein
MKLNIPRLCNGDLGFTNDYLKVAHTALISGWGAPSPLFDGVSCVHCVHFPIFSFRKSSDVQLPKWVSYEGCS